MAPLFQQPFMSGGFPSMNREGGGIGGWVELGRTTLGSAGDAITVSSLPNKRYYMVLTHFLNSGSYDHNLRLGNSSLDSGSNYSDRVEYDGGTDVTRTSQTSLYTYNAANAYPAFQVDYIANYSSKEKLVISELNRGSTSGAANVPGRSQQVGKWVNTSNAIDIIGWNNGSAGDYSSGSECVVLGWDPADTHTNNFWEELASVELGSAGDTINSGTFTAKKYIWIQAYLKNSGNLDNCRIYLGNTTIDTGSNYAIRHATNGAADGTNGSMQGAWFTVVNTAQSVFVNMFIVNNASNEKLIISHANYDGGTGAANAPQRTEMVGKWANTSNQCNTIQLYNNGSGDFDTGSILKVWGAD